MMALNPLERAYELARSGQCSNIQDIRKRLNAEGFTAVNRHLDGASIQQQLRALCAEARRD